MSIPKPRWNSGLAQAVSNGAPGCSCYSNDRADMIEELINSAEELTRALQPTGTIPNVIKVEIMLRAVQKLNAAIARAKNWK